MEGESLFGQSHPWGNWIISILSTNFISTGPSRGVEKLHTVTNRVCTMETQLVDPGASALLTQMMSDVSCTLIGWPLDSMEIKLACEDHLGHWHRCIHVFVTNLLNIDDQNCYLLHSEPIFWHVCFSFFTFSKHTVVLQMFVPDLTCCYKTCLVYYSCWPCLTSGVLHFIQKSLACWLFMQ